MLELLTSILGGGVTGLVGSAVTKVFEFKTRKLEIEAQKELMLHEVDMKKIEAAGKEAVADADAFGKSYEVEENQYSDVVKPTKAQGWVLIGLDALRGMIRPFLTLYLCILTTIIYFKANRLMGEMVPVDSAVEIVKLLISTILYLTTTCILWWFGTRNKQQAPKVG